MSVKFVTAIYSNLNGTKFGGRPARGGHYRWSLLSLLKMTDAHFTCYCATDEIEDLEDFFFEKNNVDKNQLNLKSFNLENHYFKDLFNIYKDYERAIHSDRCIELQYMKFLWVLSEMSSNYEYYFWIDAGLSHCGLIPNKYLSLTGPHNQGYYESKLFNNLFLTNLLKKTGDKFLVLAKENSRNYWSGTVNPKHFLKYDNSRHVIGGLFGGKKELFEMIINIFKSYVVDITKSDNFLYHEEDYLTLIYRNFNEFCIALEFDIWWHEDERIAGTDIVDLCSKNKSFYKILEELND